MQVYVGLIMLASVPVRRPVVYLSLKLTIYIIKIQINLVRQSLQCIGSLSRLCEFLAVN